MFAIAAQFGSTVPVIVDAPEPSPPGPGQVLCRTLELGVCGTDREILLSAHPAVPDGAQHLILGHECLARIEEVGPEVQDYSVGDLVVPAVRRASGKFPHRVDMLAFGCFVERGIWHEHGFSAPWWLDRPEHLFRVDPAIRRVAVLAEPLAVAEKGINEATVVQRARLGDQAWTDPPPRVLVTGLGPIGFAAVIACRCRNWPVAMFGRDPDSSYRAQLAVSFGATYLPASALSLDPPDVERYGFDLILECTGSDEVMLRSARSLASRGVLVWLGSTRQPEAKSLNVEQLMRDAILRNHIHLGTVNSAPRDFVEALKHLGRLWKSQPDELESLITARVAPPDSLWHYEHRQPQGIKTVLEYDES